MSKLVRNLWFTWPLKGDRRGNELQLRVQSLDLAVGQEVHHGRRGDQQQRQRDEHQESGMAVTWIPMAMRFFRPCADASRKASPPPMMAGMVCRRSRTQRWPGRPLRHTSRRAVRGVVLTQ